MRKIFICSLLFFTSISVVSAAWVVNKSAITDDDVFPFQDTSAPDGQKTGYISGELLKDYVLSDFIEFSTAAPIAYNNGVFSLTPWASQSAFETFLGWTISDSTKSPKTASKVTSTDYTIGTTSENELLSGIIVVTGSATITAPAVAVGHTYIVVTRGDVAVSLDVNANDVMTLDGVALSAGDKATNTSKSGDTIACTYVAANDMQCWSSTKLGGHWTDGN